MPNSKQAAKRLVQDERRRLANKATRTAMKSALKKVLRATTADEKSALHSNAAARIDKAAKNRVIHPNAAARLKSRLAKKLATTPA